MTSREFLKCFSLFYCWRQSFHRLSLWNRRIVEPGRNCECHYIFVVNLILNCTTTSPHSLKAHHSITPSSKGSKENSQCPALFAFIATGTSWRCAPVSSTEMSGTCWRKWRFGPNCQTMKGRCSWSWPWDVLVPCASEQFKRRQIIKENQGVTSLWIACTIQSTSKCQHFATFQLFLVFCHGSSISILYHHIFLPTACFHRHFGFFPFRVTPALAISLPS